MKIIRLSPVRHPAPKCETYEDKDAVRRFERAVRVHRAYVEPYTLTALDGRVDGAHRVTGESGGTYVVDLVDRSGTHDTCSCPDFSSNELGTCKHLEAVRRGVSSIATLTKPFEKLPREPSIPTLSVDAVDGLALSPVGPWTKRLFSEIGLSFTAEGRFRVTQATGPLKAGFLNTGVRIVHAAPAVATRIQTTQRLAERRAEVERAFLRRELGSDLLAHPLFPYQEKGLAHLVSAGRALLADDMGLGKTIQAIAACELLRARGEAKRILIVTVASLKHQWAKEIERFANERAVVVSGGAPSRRQALANDAPYKIVNYEQTWRELKLLAALDADVIIYDEAQRAKNFRTKTAATLRAIPSRFAFVLTGTPIENRLDDLFSILQIVDPAILGPLWRFNLEFHQQSDKGRIVGYKNLTKLRERTGPIILRRRKEEVLTQLPPVTEQTRYTPLTEAQRRLERGYRADAAILLSIAEHRALTKEEQDELMMLLINAQGNRVLRARGALDHPRVERKSVTDVLTRSTLLRSPFGPIGRSCVAENSIALGRTRGSGRTLDTRRPRRAGNTGWSVRGFACADNGDDSEEARFHCSILCRSGRTIQCT